MEVVAGVLVCMNSYVHEWVCEGVQMVRWVSEFDGGGEGAV